MSGKKVTLGDIYIDTHYLFKLERLRVGKRVLGIVGSGVQGRVLDDPLAGLDIVAQIGTCVLVSQIVLSVSERARPTVLQIDEIARLTLLLILCSQRTRRERHAALFALVSQVIVELIGRTRGVAASRGRRVLAELVRARVHARLVVLSLNEPVHLVVMTLPRCRTTRQPTASYATVTYRHHVECAGRFERWRSFT